MLNGFPWQQIKIILQLLRLHPNTVFQIILLTVKVTPFLLKDSCNAGDVGWTPGLGRYPGEGKGYPLQYSGLENSTDSIVHRVTESQTWLSDHCYNTLGFPCVSAGAAFMFSSL